MTGLTASQMQALAMNDGDLDSTLADGLGNPYLGYQPPFAFSLPVQLLVTGITLTLLVVLLCCLLCELKCSFLN